MSQALWTHLPGANSRGDVPWWKIAAGKRRLSSITQVTITGCVAGRLQEGNPYSWAQVSELATMRIKSYKINRL